MRRIVGISYGRLLGGIVVLLLTLVLALSPVGAEEDSGITPLFGDGKLTVTGAGFKPREKVTITAKTDGATTQLTATADAQGSFRLATGIEVKPGASVELDARGDQGTGMASIASVPLLLPRTGPATPDQLPRGGGPDLPIIPTLAISLGVLTGGLILRGARRFI